MAVRACATVETFPRRLCWNLIREHSCFYGDFLWPLFCLLARMAWLGFGLNGRERGNLVYPNQTDRQRRCLDNSVCAVHALEKSLFSFIISLRQIFHVRLKTIVAKWKPHVNDELVYFGIWPLLPRRRHISAAGVFLLNCSGAGWLDFGWMISALIVGLNTRIYLNLYRYLWGYIDDCYLLFIFMLGCQRCVHCIYWRWLFFLFICSAFCSESSDRNCRHTRLRGQMGRLNVFIFSIHFSIVSNSMI